MKMVSIVLRVLNVPLKIISIVINHFLNLFRSLWLRYQGSPDKFQKAVKKAQKLNRLTQKRYRVYFLNGRYQVMTRIQVQHLKHSKAWNRHVNMTNLTPMEYYDTNRKDAACRVSA